MLLHAPEVPRALISDIGLKGSYDRAKIKEWLTFNAWSKGASQGAQGRWDQGEPLRSFLMQIPWALDCEQESCLLVLVLMIQWANHLTSQNSRDDVPRFHIA